MSILLANSVHVADGEGWRLSAVSGGPYDEGGITFQLSPPTSTQPAPDESLTKISGEAKQPAVWIPSYCFLSTASSLPPGSLINVFDDDEIRLPQITYMTTVFSVSCGCNQIYPPPPDLSFE